MTVPGSLLLQLFTNLDEHQPDIVCGTESHLENSITTSQVFPKGFDIFRKDRSLGGEEFVLLCQTSTYSM